MPFAPRRCDPWRSRYRVRGHTARQLQRFACARSAARATDRVSSTRKSAPMRVTPLKDPRPSPRQTRCPCTQTSRDLPVSGRARARRRPACEANLPATSTRRSIEQWSPEHRGKPSPAGLRLEASLLEIYVPECGGSPANRRRVGRLRERLLARREELIQRLELARCHPRTVSKPRSISRGASPSRGFR